VQHVCGHVGAAVGDLCVCVGGGCEGVKGGGR
jgi:hypothetical protein